MRAGGTQKQPMGRFLHTLTRTDRERLVQVGSLENVFGNQRFYEFADTGPDRKSGT